MKLPHSAPSERAVLGSCLVFGTEIVGVVIERLGAEPETFHDLRHRVVWETLLALHRRGASVDVVSVELELRASEQGRLADIVYLSQLAEEASSRWAHHTESVRRLALLRRTAVACLDISERAASASPAELDEFLAAAEDQLRRATSSARRVGPLHGREPLREVWQDILDRATTGHRPRGVSTGFPDLDGMLRGGLQRGDLIVLAARPSMGKTALALAVTEAAAVAPLRRLAFDGPPVPVLFFSLEMTAAQLMGRLLCSGARVEAQRLDRGEVSQDDRDRLIATAQLLDQAPIWIDDQAAPTCPEIAARARRWRADREVFPGGHDQEGLVVVDYIQLARGGGRRYDTREQEVAEVSRSLKALSKELRLPVLALSQLNRAADNRTDHRPQLADLRESGAIEQDADVVAFLFRAERYEADEAKRRLIEAEAEVIVSKQRNGPTGTVRLHFRKAITRFESAARER